MSKTLLQYQFCTGNGGRRVQRENPMHKIFHKMLKLPSFSSVVNCKSNNAHMNSVEKLLTFSQISRRVKIVANTHKLPQMVSSPRGHVLILSRLMFKMFAFFFGRRKSGKRYTYSVENIARNKMAMKIQSDLHRSLEGFPRERTTGKSR